MKKLLIIALLVALGVAGYLGYSVIRGRGQVVTAQAAAGEQTAVVTRGDLAQTLTANGSLSPARSADLAFTSSGRIAEVLVDEGEAVVKGQALMRLDTADQALAIAQAEAGLASAQAQLEQVKSGATTAEIASAEAQLRSAQAQYRKTAAGKTNEELIIAETNLRKAEAALQQAQAAYDRVKDQPNIGMLPQSLDLQRAAQDYESAKANYAIATKAVSSDDLAVAKAGVDQAQANLDRLTEGPKPADIALREAAIKQAQAQLDQARLRQEQATLVAPFDGIVTSAHFEVGQVATGPAVSLADPNPMQVAVKLNENDIADVTPGLAVKVRVDAYPGVELAGVVESIGEVGQSQAGVVLYPVTVVLDPAPETVILRTGMTAEVRMITGQVRDALKAPVAAIRKSGSETYALKRMALSAGTKGTPLPPGAPEFIFERTPVKVGVTAGGEVEILDGLSEGDVISTAAEAETGTDALPARPFSMMRGGAAEDGAAPRGGLLPRPPAPGGN